MNSEAFPPSISRIPNYNDNGAFYSITFVPPSSRLGGKAGPKKNVRNSRGWKNNYHLRLQVGNSFENEC